MRQGINLFKIKLSVCVQILIKIKSLNVPDNKITFDFVVDC